MGNHSTAASQLEDQLDDIHDLENSLAAFPKKPIEALKDCFDISENGIGTGGPRSRDFIQSDSGQKSQQQSLTSFADQEAGKDDDRNSGQISSSPNSVTVGSKFFSSGLLIPDNVVSPKKIVADADRYQTERSYSGPMQYHQKKESNFTAGEDILEAAIVERRGRFKVTSAVMNPKGPINCFNPILGGSTSPAFPSLSAMSFLPSLQCILQHNAMQREEIVKLVKFVEQTSGNSPELEAGNSKLLQPTPTSAKEQELQAQVIQLQQSIGSLVEELQRLKTKNTQMERKLNAMLKKDNNIQE